MRWGSAIATAARLEDAVDEAAEAIGASLGGARGDLAVVFVTDHYSAHFGQLATAVGRHFPSALLLGCTAGGTIGGGVEVEHEAALSLTVASLPRTTITPIHFEPDPDDWKDTVDVDEA